MYLDGLVLCYRGMYVCILSEMSQFLYQVDEGRKWHFRQFLLVIIK